MAYRVTLYSFLSCQTVGQNGRTISQVGSHARTPLPTSEISFPGNTGTTNTCHVSGYAVVSPWAWTGISPVSEDLNISYSSSAVLSSLVKCLLKSFGGSLFNFLELRLTLPSA